MPDAEREGQTTSKAAEKERTPYVRPTLRRLGSVRELTLGGGCQNAGDTSRPFNRMRM
jgi:hypothetical protein